VSVPAAKIVSISQVDAAWAHVEVRLPPPRPRVEPGIYQAISVSLTPFNAYDRRNLELGFDVFQGDATDGVLLARLPMFLRLPGKRGLSPNSKLARLLYVLGVKPTRWTRVDLNVLRGKLWSIEVGDADRDTTNAGLPAGLAYSVVKRVISRLA